MGADLEELRRLRRARDRMDREYALPLDVPALARTALMSTAHFSRRFRDAYGESPYAYLMTRRIERAKALLRRGDDVDLRTSADRARVQDRLDELAADVDREPSAGGIAVQGLTVTAQPPAAGRELDTTAGADLAAARQAAYERVAGVRLAGAHWRTDIALAAVEGRIVLP